MKRLNSNKTAIFYQEAIHGMGYGDARLRFIYPNGKVEWVNVDNTFHKPSAPCWSVDELARNIVKDRKDAIRRMKAYDKFHFSGPAKFIGYLEDLGSVK